MLGSFIRHGLSEEEAAGEALLQIVAGSDTSASAIRTMMLHVVTNPGIYMQLQAEIDHGITSGKISSPITDTEARNLPYLQALIKEGLRYYPPAPSTMFKQVPVGGDTIDGKYLPEGTQIGGSALGIQHSKHIYGPDADLFRPERWIECFHSGKYQCLGKSVAMMEFNKLFVEVCHRALLQSMLADG
jgi:cytochrome P450